MDVEATEAHRSPPPPPPPPAGDPGLTARPSSVTLAIKWHRVEEVLHALGAKGKRR